MKKKSSSPALLGRDLIKRHYKMLQALQEHDVPHLSKAWGVRAHTVNPLPQSDELLAFYPSLQHKKVTTYLESTPLSLMSLALFARHATDRNNAGGSILYDILQNNMTRVDFPIQCLMLGTILEHRTKGTLGVAVLTRPKKDIAWQVISLRRALALDLHITEMYVGIVGEKITH